MVIEACSPYSTAESVFKGHTHCSGMKRQSAHRQTCHWAASAPGNTCGHLLQHQCHVQTAEGTQPRRQPSLETSCRRRNPLPPLQHSEMTTLRVLMPLQTGMYEIQGSDVSWSSKGRCLQQLIKGRGSTGMRAVVAPWKIPSLGKTSC